MWNWRIKMKDIKEYMIHGYRSSGISARIGEDNR